MPYQGRSPQTGVRNRFVYTATASQTLFSGADSNGRTLRYEDGAYVDVFLNGVCLVPTSDFTATTKTSITLVSGAAASDVVEVVCYDIATMADAVSKTQGGSFDGAVTVNGNFTVDNGDIKLDGNYPNGVANVALGNAALDTASGANGYSVAIGNNALTAMTTGGSNTAVGAGAAVAINSGANNIALGTDALASATTSNFNTAVGSAALQNNTTASNNTAVGYQALYDNVTGTSLVAVGYQALANNLGNSNTAVGLSALFANTTGTENTGLGTGALYANTTGASNSAVGYGALDSNTTGSYNTALGRDALTANTTGQRNVSIGYASSYSNSTGQYNVAVGMDALSSHTGSNSTAIGYQAMFSTTSAYGTAVGQSSLYSNTTGTHNTAIGSQSLNNNTTGYYNTALGHNSSYSQTTGLANTSVGYLAGYSTTTGSGNAAFGKDALKNATTAGYNTAIGERAFGNGTLTATAAYNTALGHYAGYELTGSAINNTFLGSSAGYLVTSGSKNTIVGRFNGNTFLDMRTLNNHVVLSDGDGLARIIHDGDDVWLDTSYEGYSGADNNLALFKRINVGNLASGGTPVDEDEINRGVAYITGEVGYDNTFRTVIDNISGNLVGFMVHGQVGVSDKTQDQFAFLCSRRGLSGGLEFMNSGGSSVVQMNWTGSVYQLQLKSSSSTYGQGFYLMVRPL